VSVCSKCHQGKEKEEGREGKKRERQKGVLSEVIIIAVSGGQNELLSKFKIMTSDVIDIAGSLWSTGTSQH
jgi:hypothetical protein